MRDRPDAALRSRRCSPCCAISPGALASSSTRPVATDTRSRGWYASSPDAPGRARRRPDQRRQAAGLRPSAFQERSRVCALQRHRATARLIRPDDPPPPLPRRRPPSQQRDPHDRHVTIDQPRRVTRLPRTQNQPRQDPPRSHARTQTPRLPPPLPPTHRNALDTIEASMRPERVERAASAYGSYSDRDVDEARMISRDPPPPGTRPRCAPQV